MAINQAYIYLVNKHDILLNIYKFKDENIDYSEDEIIKNNSKIIYSSLNQDNTSYRSKVLYAFKKIPNLNVQKDRIINVNNNTLYMYVQCDSTLKDKEFDDINMSAYFSVEKEKEDDIKKLYKKFDKKINKQKHRYRRTALLPSRETWLLFAFSIISFLCSTLIDYINGSKTDFLWIIPLSLVILKWGFSSIINYISLKRNYIGSIQSKLDDERIKEVMKSITNNKNKFYKDFIKEDFMSDKVGEAFLINDEQNINLHENADSMSVKIEKYSKLKSEQQKRLYSSVYSEKIKDKQIIYDSDLCGLDTDLNFYNGEIISIKKIKYSTYVCNDDMIYRTLSIASDPNYYVDGRELTLDKATGGFKNMKKSTLANTIGINLIVELVTDKAKYYIVNRQCTYTNVNQAKYVPSASGSMDYKDYKKNKEANFKDLLKYAMLRELYEESYIESHYFHDNIRHAELINESTQFELLGVARLYSKAGKPDFFGKITININEEDIEKILKNYNEAQSYFLSKKKEKSHLESTYMHIIEEKEFLGEIEKNIYSKDDSIQLKYTKYLINYYNKL